ncbi:MAG: DMT family transporter [Desulfarculaceae bacterium]|nr:DMT family transporter [Desulfarculaceae bacterium]
MKPGNPLHRSPAASVHLAVLLFGFSGLFGKLLALSPILIVLGRTAFAALSLLLFAQVFTRTRLLPSSRREGVFLVLQGLLLAVHWLFFFHSIQVSTVAVGLISFSTFPMFTTLMEPVFFKERLRVKDMVASLLVLAGTYLVIPSLTLANDITRGAAAGILAGLTFALLTLLNRRNVVHTNAICAAFYQNSFACLFLVLPALWIRSTGPTPRDILLLSILGIFCTGLAHTLFIRSLGYIRARTASIVTGLEPVWGIVFAFFILKEVPGIQTLAGGIVILGASIMAQTTPQA